MSPALARAATPTVALALALLVSPLALPAPLVAQGDLPRYLGPLDAAQAALPDVSEHVQVGYEWLGSAFGAVSAGDLGQARSDLEQTARVFRGALEANPHARDAALGFGIAWFYQAYYGAGGSWERAIEFLTRILEVDPYAADAARYLANAYAQLGDARSTRYYANYVKAVALDAELHREMTALLAPFEQAFLEGWYAYADYYERPEAKVTTFNPSTFQVETILHVTPEFEMSLGARGLTRDHAGSGPPAAAEIGAYLQGLVDRLESATAGPPIHNVVEVVDSPEPNAAALPGRIIVNTGLIRFAESEAELVAVLAHELGHVYAHHAARLTVNEVRSRMTASALVSLLNVQNQLYQQLIDIGVNVGIDLLLKGYSRQYESEADRYATHIAFNAGYNPTFMTALFVRLYRLNPSTPFRLTSTHPPTSERIEETTSYLDGFPLDREMQVDSRDFQEIRRRLGG